MTFLPQCAIIIAESFFKLLQIKKGVIKIELRFEVNSAEQFGTIIVTGIKYHRTKSFDPIYKTWASLRKRVREQLEIDVVGLFIYDDIQEKLSCNFSLNSICIDGRSKRIFRENFKKNIATRFINTITVLLATMRYDNEYQILLKSDASEKEFIDYLNKFLKNFNLRTEDDEKKAVEKAKKIEQAKKTIKQPLPGALDHLPFR